MDKLTKVYATLDIDGDVYATIGDGHHPQSAGKHTHTHKHTHAHTHSLKVNVGVQMYYELLAVLLLRNIFTPIPPSFFITKWHTCDIYLKTYFGQEIKMLLDLIIKSEGMRQ